MGRSTRTYFCRNLRTVEIQFPHCVPLLHCRLSGCVGWKHAFSGIGVWTQAWKHRFVQVRRLSCASVSWMLIWIIIMYGCVFMIDLKYCRSNDRMITWLCLQPAGGRHGQWSNAAAGASFHRPDWTAKSTSRQVNTSRHLATIGPQYMMLYQAISRSAFPCLEVSRLTFLNLKVSNKLIVTKFLLWALQASTMEIADDWRNLVANVINLKILTKH